MSQVAQKNELQESEKIDNQNSQNMIIQNNDSNRYSTNNYKNLPSSRKTSKRRQAQQEKAAVLELFKQLLKVVNQKFQNAYLSPPKQKIPKPPKMQKNQSIKVNKKQQSQKNKKQDSVSANYPVINKSQDKSESRQINPIIIPQILINNQPNNLIPNSSPLFLPSYNSNSQFSSHVRKGSQSHGHRQKSLNQKHQLLKQTLKKQIFQNYSVSMKYIIHQDFYQEIQESKQIDHQSKMIDQQSEHIVHIKFQKTYKNDQRDEPYQDFELLSHEQKMHQQFIKSMKNIDNQMDIEEKEIIQEAQKEQKKLQEGQEQESSSSSCEENQKYPPHSHMPEGHASTTEQFLQQHHPIQTTLPHSCQSLPVIEHHEPQDQDNKQISKSVSKLPQQNLEQEKNC